MPGLARERASAPRKRIRRHRRVDHVEEHARRAATCVPAGIGYVVSARSRDLDDQLRRCARAARRRRITESAPANRATPDRGGCRARPARPPLRAPQFDAHDLRFEVGVAPACGEHARRRRCGVVRGPVREELRGDLRSCAWSECHALHRDRDGGERGARLRAEANVDERHVEFRSLREGNTRAVTCASRMKPSRTRRKRGVDRRLRGGRCVGAENC